MRDPVVTLPDVIPYAAEALQEAKTLAEAWRLLKAALPTTAESILSEAVTGLLGGDIIMPEILPGARVVPGEVLVGGILYCRERRRASRRPGPCHGHQWAQVWTLMLQVRDPR